LPDNSETAVTPKDFPDTGCNEYINTIAARGQDTSIAFIDYDDEQYMNVNDDVENGMCFTPFFLSFISNRTEDKPLFE